MALWTSSDAIVEFLEELKEQNEKKTKVLHHLITCFDFILTLMFMRQVMFRTKVLEEKL